MDLDYLRALSQEGQSDIAEQILKKCDPQKIAQYLMSELQTKANEAAKKGEHRAGAFFYVWEERQLGNYRNFDGSFTQGQEYREGPLVDFPNREKASEVLFTMVKQYIEDNNILLELCETNKSYENYNYTRGQYIRISVKW